MGLFFREKYFFDNGIRFECRRCGHCCTGESGTIYVAPEEIQTISKYLNISADTFRHDYCYPFQDSYSIREEEDGRCVFYNAGCRIYSVRPSQCKTYPFWKRILQSRERWQRESDECPGIGSGRLFSADEILEIFHNSIL